MRTCVSLFKGIIMANVLIFVLFAVGIVLIVKGGDVFVDSATWIAEVSGIPKFLIGATVVSIATTLPELLVSILAAAGGKTDMAIGNAIGSVTVNIGLIFAISLIFIPAVIKRKNFAFKAILMCVSIGLIWLFSRKGSMNIYGACVILALFVVFIVENVIDAKRSITASGPEDKPSTSKKDVIINVSKFVVGAGAVALGAHLLVDNGSKIAIMLGVPEAVVSVTVISLGTSLPELVTAITAIIKKQGSLSVGNILGANIIDLALIMPICSIISGGSLPVNEQSRLLDMPFCALVALLATVPTLIFGKLKRSQGILIILTYAVYLTLLFIYFI